MENENKNAKKQVYVPKPFKDLKAGGLIYTFNYITPKDMLCFQVDFVKVGPSGRMYITASNVEKPSSVFQFVVEAKGAGKCVFYATEYNSIIFSDEYEWLNKSKEYLEKIRGNYEDGIKRLEYCVDVYKKRYGLEGGKK